MMREPIRNEIVADGRRRILAGPHHQATSHAFRDKIMRRCAPLLARSSLLGRLVIRIRIQRYLQRRLNKIAPPYALYSRGTQTSRDALHLTTRCSERLPATRPRFPMIRTLLLRLDTRFR